MPDYLPSRPAQPGFIGPSADSEGGLRAPPGLSFWGKAWWWFDFLILVKLARLRFIAILVAIGLVIVKWETLTAYYERWTRPVGEEKTSVADTEYFCPMHPTVIRDNSKEKCPICFMPLSRRKKGEGELEPLPPGIANRVQLSPYRVVLAGIKTWPVAYEPLYKEITTVGFLEFNERETKQITARVKGWLEKLYVNETGEMVHKGDPLAALYSPELRVTVQNLIDAKNQGNTSLMQAARKRLEAWRISDKEIAEIENTKDPNTPLTIRSPIEGHVIKKYVKEGQSVEEGSPLYDIVDLSTLWIQAQVYEDDLPFLPAFHSPLTKEEALKEGLPVTAAIRAFPGQTFEGRLTFVLPHLDQETRSVVARFELENPDHKLRPGSSATVKFKVPPRQLEVLSQSLGQEWAVTNAAAGLVQGAYSPIGPSLRIDLWPLIRAAQRFAALGNGRVLAVPEGAVIDTGTQQLVYRQVIPGHYEGVLVLLGPRMVGPKDMAFYPVLRGLNPGDEVVASGSFLIDAETRLNPAAGSIYFGGSGGSKTGQTSTVRPSTPEDKSLMGLGGG